MHLYITHEGKVSQLMVSDGKSLVKKINLFCFAHLIETFSSEGTFREGFVHGIAKGCEWIK